MTFRNRKQQFNRLLALGMMLLALANIGPRLFERHALFSQGWTDGLAGLLFGLAFGCIFLGFRQNRHRCASYAQPGA